MRLIPSQIVKPYCKSNKNCFIDFVEIAFLVATVIATGIMAERLAGSNIAGTYSMCWPETR